MIRTRFAILAALTATGVAVLTACDSGVAATGPVAAPVHLTGGTAEYNNAAADTGDFFQGPADSPTSMKWVQLSAGAAGPLNPIVRNGAGLTLYRFDKDTTHPAASHCTGTCAATWPPVLVEPGARIFIDGVAKADVGVLHRADGTMQVTIGGWPIYRYSKDTAPGQANGQGVGGTWFAVTPEGGKAGPSPQGTDSGTDLEYHNGTAAENNAPPDTGDFYHGPRDNPAAMKWVQLTAGSADGLTPIVHDGAGFTLYRFDKDTAHPAMSHCTGTCATTWPPVLVKHGARIFVDGVPAALIGIVTRPDGTRQVTIGGWPIYRYSKDTAPGQTNGEGVGGTWFAVSPHGAKVLPPAGATLPPPTTTSTRPTDPGTGSIGLGNGSVILDSGTNFTEPGGSEGTAGPGCKNVAQPDLASSFTLAGGPVELWTGRDCTGSSAVVTGNVADLAVIGFDKRITSILFGA